MEKILSKVKPGVVYGKDLQEIFRNLNLTMRVI